ncbi:hypothetical protein B566_EDAN005148 [Ephemera danica]|nr:hypothetical protein B566_EDAN005148 [Ephemera danica]
MDSLEHVELRTFLAFIIMLNRFLQSTTCRHRFLGILLPTFSGKLKLYTCKKNLSHSFIPISKANWIQLRLYHEREKISGPLTELTYEQVCSETLDSLAEYFEELLEQCPQLSDSDVNLGDGVLTVKLGNDHGTYVINRQRPNLQIWLSSPSSGPKRYDFIGGCWVYRHDSMTLHSLLQSEISKIVQGPVDFSKCAYSSE